jgi:hypothetical protein
MPKPTLNAMFGLKKRVTEIEDALDRFAPANIYGRFNLKAGIEELHGKWITKLLNFKVEFEQIWTGKILDSENKLNDHETRFAEVHKELSERISAFEKQIPYFTPAIISDHEARLTKLEMADSELMLRNAVSNATATSVSLAEQVRQLESKLSEPGLWSKLSEVERRLRQNESMVEKMDAIAHEIGRLDERTDARLIKLENLSKGFNARIDGVRDLLEKAQKDDHATLDAAMNALEAAFDGLAENIQQLNDIVTLDLKQRKKAVRIVPEETVTTPEHVEIVKLGE